MSQAEEIRQDEVTGRVAAAASSAEQLTRDIGDAFRQEQVENLIHRHVLTSAAIGLVPLPLVDMAALVAIQLAMARTLAGYYQVPFDEIRARAVVISLLAGSTPVLSVVALSSMANLIPGIGSLFGSGSVAVAGGALTYAVGRTLVHHFESGGTLLDVEPKELRTSFKREIQRGREIATSVIRNRRRRAPAGVDDAEA